MKVFLTTIVVLMYTMIYAQNSSLTVHITNCKNNKGKVMVAIFNTSESFLHKPLYGKVSEIKAQAAKVVFENLPNGVYAISTYQDENDNQKLDTGMFGIPKERYGFSNDAKGSMGPPKYEAAKFQLNQQKTMVIKLH